MIARTIARHTGLARALGDRARHWITLNEPWCIAFLSHEIGAHAPGLQDRALAYQAARDWPSRRCECGALLSSALAAIESLTGLAPFVAPRERWHAQLGVARLPAATDVDDLKRRLYDEHAIEVPVYRWQDQPLIRVSCQVYNTAADIEALTSALRQLVTVQV